MSLSKVVRHAARELSPLALLATILAVLFGLEAPAQATSWHPFCAPQAMTPDAFCWGPSANATAVLAQNAYGNAFTVCVTVADAPNTASAARPWVCGAGSAANAVAGAGIHNPLIRNGTHGQTVNGSYATADGLAAARRAAAPDGVDDALASLADALGLDAGSLRSVAGVAAAGTRAAPDGGSADPDGVKAAAAVQAAWRGSSPERDCLIVQLEDAGLGATCQPAGGDPAKLVLTVRLALPASPETDVVVRASAAAR